MLKLYKLFFHFCAILSIIACYTDLNSVIKLKKIRPSSTQQSEKRNENTEEINSKEPRKISKQPSQHEIMTLQTILPPLEGIAGEADHTLRIFEKILDTVSTILSQKRDKLGHKQQEIVKEILEQIGELRTSLYSSRVKLFDSLENTLKDSLDLPEIKSFLNGLASLLHLAAQFAQHLDIVIKSKMLHTKSFNMVSYVKHAKNIDPRKTLINDLYVLQQTTASIEYEILNIDVTKLNKITRFIDQHIFTNFYKWHLNEVLWYAAGWGSIGSLLLWKIAGQYLADHEYKYQRSGEDPLVSKAHITSPYNGQHPKTIDESCFIDDERGLFKDRKDKKDRLEFTDPYKKTLSWPHKLAYKFLKAGLPSDYFEPTELIDQGKKFEYRTVKTELYGEQNKTTLSQIDHSISRLLSNHYPTVTFAASLLWPTFSQQLSENIWPTITGMVQAIWNKMRGGIFEKKMIEGDYLVFSDETFDDVIGMEKEKRELLVLIEFLLDPVTFTQKHGNKITKAFLLTGDTRTGKTYFYRCFVGTLQQRLRMLGRPITNIQAFEFPTSVVKKHGITVILKILKQNAPAVAFVDEIDLVQLQRSTDAVVLADFLTGMVLILDPDPTKTVILFFATNKPQHLDKALRTTGRFGKEIPFDYPSLENRRKFLELKFKNLGLDITKFDIETIIQQLNQQSYETIEHLLHAALMEASVSDVPFSQEIFEAVIDNEILKILPTNRKNLGKNEWDILAAHFAGHALLFLLFLMPELLHKVTLCAFITSSKEEHVYMDVMKEEQEKQKKVVFGGTFTTAEGDSEKLSTRELIENQIKRLLSGFVAEEILLGSCGYSCHPEFKDEAYKKVITLLIGGVKFDELPDSQKTYISQKAFELLEQYTKELKEELLKNKELLKTISDALLKEKTLSLHQLQQLKKDFDEKQKKKIVETTSAS